jgi:hypothetical protein
MSIAGGNGEVRLLEGSFAIMAPPDLIFDSIALISEAASSRGTTRAPQARAVA